MGNKKEIFVLIIIIAIFLIIVIPSIKNMGLGMNLQRLGNSEDMIEEEYKINEGLVKVEQKFSVYTNIRNYTKVHTEL